MNRRAWDITFILVATLAALPGLAAGTDPSPHSTLKDVPGLEKPVTYTETKIPLGELVAKVAADTGAALTAVKEVADEPVAVVVHDFPARNLLEQLANLLDYQWSRRGREGAWRYEIWQDLASKQREEALRQAQREEVEKRFREELDRLREAAGLSEQELRRVLDAAQRQDEELAKLPPEERTARASSPDAIALGQRRRAAMQVRSPINRGIVTLLTSLSAQQWQSAHQGQPISFASQPQPGELSLPAGMADRFRKSPVPTHEILPPPANPPEKVEWFRRLDEETQAQWDAATGYRVTMKVWADRPTTGALLLNAHATPIRTGIAPDALPYAGSLGPTVIIQINPPRPQEDPEAAARRREELERDPVLGARKRFVPEGKPHLQPDWSEAGGISRTVQDLLPDLARTYGVQFVADSYWTSSHFFGPMRATDPTALFVLLDRYAGRSHRWDRVGNLIRLRSRTWFLDRPREIPLRFVRRWVELCDRRGALPLEEYLGMVTELTEEQLTGLDQLVPDGALPHQLQDLASVPRARQALRLYGSLLPAVQQALWQGGSLPVAQMTPPQRGLFLAALQQANRERWAPLNLQPWADGSLSLASESYVRTKEDHGRSISYRSEPVVAPQASPPRAPSSPPRGSTIVPSPAATRAGAGANPGWTTRYALKLVKFQLGYAAEKPENVSLMVAPPP